MHESTELQDGTKSGVHPTVIGTDVHVRIDAQKRNGGKYNGYVEWCGEVQGNLRAWLDDSLRVAIPAKGFATWRKVNTVDFRQSGPSLHERSCMTEALAPSEVERAPCDGLTWEVTVTHPRWA